jgi:ABC-2 type transport system ATP-binding protein
MVSVLQLEHLRVVFRVNRTKKQIIAVDDITLRVEEGEVVGFIGPNGAGKTTTIKILMGFLFPTSGTARVLGYEAGSKNARSRTGYLPEVALYYPFMTAGEILLLYGRLQGIGRKALQEMIPRLIKQVGLAGFEKLRLRDYSRGMLQRVGLAQAIMGEPELLILDEVTSGLDPVGRRDLRDILMNFKNQGKTVFFSSHELSEVAKICDRIILINGGKVIQEKPLQEILESRKIFRLSIQIEGPLPSLPEQVRISKRKDGFYQLETNSKQIHLDLLLALPRAGARILDVETLEASLEDYFVEVVEHKVA